MQTKNKEVTYNDEELLVKLLKEKYKIQFLTEGKNGYTLKGHEFATMAEKLGVILSTSKNDREVLFDEYGLLENI